MAFAGVPTEAEVLAWYRDENNWGRWGQQDQLGALNLITTAKRTQAAALVQTGETVSCARPITTEMTPDITHQVQRFMVDSGEGRDTDPWNGATPGAAPPSSSAWSSMGRPSPTSTLCPTTPTTA